VKIQVLVILKKYSSVLIYGAALAMLLLLLRWVEWQFIFVDNSFELYAGAIAVLFTVLGIWLAQKLSKPRTILLEKEVMVPANGSFELNTRAATDLGLSKRELEVLALMAAGMSNQQIAEQLFVSLNTVKTHLSNVFLKLDVQRRTQAVEKARRLSLVP
jgi:NarL family two-component system response regulator LiaR